MYLVSFDINSQYLVRFSQYLVKIHGPSCHGPYVLCMQVSIWFLRRGCKPPIGSVAYPLCSDIYSRGQRLAVRNILNIPSGQRLTVINVYFDGLGLITSPWRCCVASRRGFFPEKMTSLEILDMYLIIFDVFSQYLRLDQRLAVRNI